MSEIEKQMKEVLESIEEKIAELKQVKQSLIKCKLDYECACMERDGLRRSNERLLTLLKELGKENCDNCVKAKEKGVSIACCNCKWSEIIGFYKN